MLSRVLLALVAVLCLYSTPSFAASDNTSVDPERDEYDFSWLDPDKKIYVVQNRKFMKAKSLELSVSLGVGMGETYRTQRQLRGRGVFYLNEHWGVSGFYFANTNSENDTMTALKGVSGTVPAVRDTNKYMGASVMYVPFYGKINIFNQIYYIDWHFELGLGSASTEVDLNTRATGSPNLEFASYGAYHWGSGWKFFITRNFAARLDFLATYYTAPSAIAGSVAGSDDVKFDNYYLTLGLGYTF